MCVVIYLYTRGENYTVNGTKCKQLMNLNKGYMKVFYTITATFLKV